ncbi:hypothetical protein D3C76_1432680 [compost metagenome]
MLKTNQFILLRMIFDMALYDAVMSKNKSEIEYILNSTYVEEINNRIFVDPEPIDTEYLYAEHIRQVEEEKAIGSNFNWT